MRELRLDKLPKKVLSKLDLERVFIASRCLLAAERLSLFRLLHERELSTDEIGKLTGIKRRHCESFLDLLVSLGLLKTHDGLYSNSRLATKHLIQERSDEWTRLWSGECIKDYEAFTVLEDVLTSGKGWRQLLGTERKPDYELAKTDPQWARDFAYALYDRYKQDAQILAQHLDLSDYQSLLDVGGGSGVMSFALVRAYPHLTACILELKFVSDAADEIIRSEGLSHRVTAQAGDMNRSIPRGFDTIMFWNVGLIDPRVIKMAYESLPEGGMIVRDCVPPSRSAAPSAAAFIHDYLSVRPQAEGKSSIISSLKKAGFTSVRYRRISQGIGLITAHKGRVRRRQTT